MENCLLHNFKLKAGAECSIKLYRDSVAVSAGTELDLWRMGGNSLDLHFYGKVSFFQALEIGFNVASVHLKRRVGFVPFCQKNDECHKKPWGYWKTTFWNRKKSNFRHDD